MNSGNKKILYSQYGLGPIPTAIMLEYVHHTPNYGQAAGEDVVVICAIGEYDNGYPCLFTDLARKLN